MLNSSDIFKTKNKLLLPCRNQKLTRYFPCRLPRTPFCTLMNGANDVIATNELKWEPVSIFLDSGYPHDGRADKNPYPHDRRADKDSF